MIHTPEEEAQSLAEAELQAKQCFLPLLLVRRHAHVQMKNVDHDFQECLKAQDQAYEEQAGGMRLDHLDSLKVQCL